MATNKPAQEELYVSCRPQRPPRAFCVAPGQGCVIQACGLGPDQTIPVLKSYGDDQCEPARDLAGELIVLTAEKPSVVMVLSGNYKLDITALELDPCVYVTEECYELSDLPGGGVCSTPPTTSMPSDQGELTELLAKLSAACVPCEPIEPTEQTEEP